jgi:hypothetical protein
VSRYGRSGWGSTPGLGHPVWVGPVSLTVWFGADTADFPEGGGYLWAYMSWALGLRALGCRVVWLEPCEAGASADEVGALVRSLRQRLEPYGLADEIAVCPRSDKLAAAPSEPEGCVSLETAREADLFLNVSYNEHRALLPLFRRTAVVDFDPGLLQMWIDQGELVLPRYDVYFTTGENVSLESARFSGGGLSWQYAPECVALDWWPVCEAPENAPFTTLSGWDTDDWFHDGSDWYPNSKRDGFLPYLDLPRYTTQPLELALRIWKHKEEERTELERRGWRVVHAYEAASTAEDYQHYVQSSRGEFSCAKPSCAGLANAWISDRTLAYLASGKPAVVEYTGPSRILPDAEGLFRFRTVAEAARHLETAVTEYEHHGRLARALAEEYFDAKKVLQSVLERAL